MDDKIARALRAVRDFSSLRQLETNARDRITFDQEIDLRFRLRGQELAREELKTRLNFSLTDLTPAEEKIVEAVSEYQAIKRRQGCDATRTIRQINTHGLKKAAEKSVSKRTQGFDTLQRENRDELSYEQIIVDHSEEFTDRALWFARKRLGHANVTEKPPTENLRPLRVSTETALSEKATQPEQSGTSTLAKNPNWSRDEHILGLDLYFKLRETTFPVEHPEVVLVSNTLQRLAKLRGVRGTDTFRNTNSVAMKMNNFRRLDPEYDGSGLLSGSKIEVQVWNEFFGQLEALESAVEDILYEIEMGDVGLKSESGDAIVGQYWVLVCNPTKWAVDRFLLSNVTVDSWGVRPSDKTKFAPGQLAIIRVGVDRRNKRALDGRERLEPGIYAVCEVESLVYPATGANDEYWSPDAARAPGWPTVKIRYLRNYLDKPLTIQRLKSERPNVSPLLINGFQASTFPIEASDFRAVLELLNEDPEQIAGELVDVEVSTYDRLEELEKKYINASPEVRARVSNGIERGPIGREVKRLNGNKCQICEQLGQNPFGFKKRNGEYYVEAHHVMPVHLKAVGSLSATNIVTLCANHHREVHYGEAEVVSINDDSFVFNLSGSEIKISRPRVKI